MKTSQRWQECWVTSGKNGFHNNPASWIKSNVVKNSQVCTQQLPIDAKLSCTFHNIYIIAAEIKGQIHWRSLGTCFNLWLNTNVHLSALLTSKHLSKHNLCFLPELSILSFYLLYLLKALKGEPKSELLSARCWENRGNSFPILKSL